MTQKKAKALRNELQRFDRLLEEVLALISDPDRARATRPSSGWSVLGHAEHLGKANSAGLAQLEKASQRTGGLPMRWVGRPILALRYIPRGAANVPNGFGAEGWPLARVVAALEEQRQQVGQLADRCAQLADSTGRSKHPVFGGLDACQWARFLSIHTAHHLSIAKGLLPRA